MGEFTEAAAKVAAAQRAAELAAEGLSPVVGDSHGLGFHLAGAPGAPWWRMERTGGVERFRPQRGTGRRGWRPGEMAWAPTWVVAVACALRRSRGDDELCLRVLRAVEADAELRAAVEAVYRIEYARLGGNWPGAARSVRALDAREARMGERGVFGA